MSWPSIQAPSYPLEEIVFKPQIKSEFESGYVQSRPRATIAKRRFTLRWKAMSDAHFSSLCSAFTADVGSTFSWNHPATGSAYTVRYTSDSIESSVTVPGYRQVQLSIEEAP